MQMSKSIANLSQMVINNFQKMHVKTHSVTYTKAQTLRSEEKHRVAAKLLVSAEIHCAVTVEQNRQRKVRSELRRGDRSYIDDR